ncbi:MAG: peptidylprolyl isomerase [Salinisphaeraceae bacterium]|nr:peptidylprolyl isomerase [Salinisphaeraceae bacterium]
MQIANACVASIHYTLKNDAGEVLDSSEGREPLLYLHGAGNIIPGLESALDGKAAGDQLNVQVDPEQGYGPHREDLIQTVPRDQFQGVDQIDVGMRFQAESNQGPMVVTVTAVDEQNVTVDGNHPLAGENLNFEVEVVEVREATAEEKDHGHPHGPGGHQH